MKYLRDVIYGWPHGGGGGDDVDGGGRQLFPSLSEEKRLETWPPSPSFLVVLVVKSFRTVGSVPLAALQVPHLGPLILMRGVCRVGNSQTDGRG